MSWNFIFLLWSHPGWEHRLYREDGVGHCDIRRAFWMLGFFTVFILYCLNYSKINNNYIMKIIRNQTDWNQWEVEERVALCWPLGGKNVSLRSFSLVSLFKPWGYVHLHIQSVAGNHLCSPFLTLNTLIFNLGPSSHCYLLHVMFWEINFRLTYL